MMQQQQTTVVTAAMVLGDVDMDGSAGRRAPKLRSSADRPLARAAAADGVLRECGVHLELLGQLLRRLDIQEGAQEDSVAAALRLSLVESSAALGRAPSPPHLEVAVAPAVPAAPSDTASSLRKQLDLAGDVSSIIGNGNGVGEAAQWIPAAPSAETAGHRVEDDENLPKKRSTFDRLTNRRSSLGSAEMEQGASSSGLQIFRARLREYLDTYTFEVCSCVLISLNTVIMAAEQQYLGVERGFDLGFYDSSSMWERSWSWAVPTFSILEAILAIIFSIELLLKIFAYGTFFFRDGFNILDCVIVLFSDMGLIFTQALFARFNVLRILRIARLVRLLRIARRLEGFDSLYLLTTAIWSSFGILGWALILLFFLQLVFAIPLGYLLHATYLKDVGTPEPEHLVVYEYFGTFTRSVLSMFEMTLANWPPICRMLTEDVNELFMPFCILHKIACGFAILGVINGVFIQETFKVASIDDTIMARTTQLASKMHEEKMGILFSHMDTNNSGELSLDEFAEAVQDESLKCWLAAMDIDVTDVHRLFQLIDSESGNGSKADGKLTLPELVRGTARYRGHASNIDMKTLIDMTKQTVMPQMASLSGHVQRLALQVAALQEQLRDGATAPERPVEPKARAFPEVVEPKAAAAESRGGSISRGRRRPDIVARERGESPATPVSYAAGKAKNKISASN